MLFSSASSRVLFSLVTSLLTHMLCSHIRDADEGLLWVGYVQPARGPIPARERYAAIKWVKTAEFAPKDSCEEDMFCCVCFDKPVSCKLHPCQHAQFCMECIIENACRWNQRDSPGK